MAAKRPDARSLLPLLLVALAGPAVAGPPFLTDDPEPVEEGGGELYLASIDQRSEGTTTGTAPHVEVNYGATKDLQLHLIAPMAYIHGPGSSLYGYGDTELGAKWRFVQESGHRPQVGVFPLLELPTGDAHRGLGTGHLHLFLPVWVQKSWAGWTSYGGGGIWINPGTGNRPYGFVGAAVQREVRTGWLLGLEVFHQSSPQDGAPALTAANLGTVIDCSEHLHLMGSAGRQLVGTPAELAYVATQWTW